MTYASYRCQKCGEQIGYIGRFFQFLRIPLHRCKKPYKPKIRIDNSGASTWVNMVEFYLSDEGKEFLKKMSEFAKRHIKKND
jgi:hypothetical protein